MGNLKVWFFSMSKKVGGTNPRTALSGQLWALDPCRPEGTEGVHAFKTQLMRAKERDLIQTIQYAFSLKKQGHFAAFASDGLLTSDIWIGSML